MADPDETEIEITSSPICLDCGADIADRAATSLCEVCENRLLSHLPSRQDAGLEQNTETNETDQETAEDDGKVSNDGS